MGSVGRQFVGNPENAENCDGVSAGGWGLPRERRRVSPAAVGVEEKRVTRCWRFGPMEQVKEERNGEGQMEGRGIATEE